MRRSVVVAGTEVAAGRRVRIDVPAGSLVTGTPLSMPTIVVNGRDDGPRLFLTAAIHGDEINGVQIIRLLLRRVRARELRGLIVALPIVNVFGFSSGSRYLPDRRDLNRAFPGSARGSLAARIADLVMEHVVANTDLGIDFHTAADQRINVPHIRGDLDDPHTHHLAVTFGAPIVVHAQLRDGSLREAATAAGHTVLVFEGGQARRFDPDAVKVGVDGTLRVMSELGMISAPLPSPAGPPTEARSTRWVRARRSGVFTPTVALGSPIAEGQVIGEISDVLEPRPARVRAPADGWVIGLNQSPLVHRGDALFNIGVAGRPPD
jgi:predicted deacylase